MRPPRFPPGYIFDVVNLELASDGCAPLENGDTDKLVDKDKQRRTQLIDTHAGLLGHLTLCLASFQRDVHGRGGGR